MDKEECSSPRFIDTIESAQDATPVKVIVVSASRYVAIFLETEPILMCLMNK